jgi:hypothetical protein
MKKRLAYSPGRLVAILRRLRHHQHRNGRRRDYPADRRNFRGDGSAGGVDGGRLRAYRRRLGPGDAAVVFRHRPPDRLRSLRLRPQSALRGAAALRTADRTGPRSALPHPRNKPHAGAESAYRAQRPRRKRRLPDEGRFETLLDGPRPQRRRRAESRMTGSGNEEPKNRGNSGCECTSGVFICPSPTD